MNTTTDPQAPYETPAASPAPPLAAGVGGESPTFRVLTADERATIKQLAEAAAPFPWKATGAATGDNCVVDANGNTVAALTAAYPEGAIYMDEEDAAYIAAVSPDVTLGTLAYVEHLEAANAALTARLTTEAAAAEEAKAALEAAVRSALLEQSVWLEGTRKLKADLTEARAEAAEAKREKLQLHEELRGLRAGNPFLPADKWNDEDGDVLWWRFPIDEPPYVGSPCDTDWHENGYGDYYTHFQKWDYRGYNPETSPAGSLHSEEAGKGGVGNV